MEMQAKSTDNHGDTADEYFIPLKPNHAVALTMNFPQLSPSTADDSSHRQTGFNHECPDCMADVFGPIMAPYAALQQQTEDYRARLEDIAYRRYLTMKSHLFDTSQRKLKRRWKRRFRVLLLCARDVTSSLLYRLAPIQVRYPGGE